MKLKIWLVVLLIFSLLPQGATAKIKSEDIISLGILLLDDDLAERVLGQVGSTAFENRFGVINDPQINARIANIGNRLTQYVSRKKVNYQFRVTGNSEVNACAIPGGYIYVNQGLLNCPGLSDAELAFVLSHEIIHVDRRHGLKQMKSALPLSILAGEIKSEDAQSIAQIVFSLYTAGRSRTDEKEADLKGFELMTQAGFEPSAGLAFMRRLETLSKRDPSPFERLFMTHPPTHERAEALKDAFLRFTLGSDYRALAAERTEGYLPDDGLAKFKEMTGREVYHVGKDNPFEPSNKGQCTWFVYAVRSDKLPVKGDARRWFQVLKEAGYETGEEPKEGAIACFDRTSKNRYGHVAFVTKVEPDRIEVWDSNWKKDQRIRRHILANIKELCSNFQGFVYWRPGQAPPQPSNPSPPPSSQPSSPRRDQIEIEKGPKHLGDDAPNAKVIETKEITLSEEDLKNRSEAAVQLRVKGVPKKDPIISVNRKEIGRAVTKGDQWEWFEFKFSPSLLRVGKNLFDIETLIPSLHESFDDCEFADMVLILR